MKTGKSWKAIPFGFESGSEIEGDVEGCRTGYDIGYPEDFCLQQFDKIFFPLKLEYMENRGGFDESTIRRIYHVQLKEEWIREQRRTVGRP